MLCDALGLSMLFFIDTGVVAFIEKTCMKIKIRHIVAGFTIM